MKEDTRTISLRLPAELADTEVEDWCCYEAPEDVRVMASEVADKIRELSPIEVETYLRIFERTV